MTGVQTCALPISVATTIASALYRKKIQKQRKEYLRTQQNQAALYRIIGISNQFSQEEEMLADCLKALLDIDWLNIEKKGYIYLFDVKKNENNLAIKYLKCETHSVRILVLTRELEPFKYKHLFEQ